MVKHSSSSAKPKQVILAVAIAILFAIFVNVGIGLVYERPDYEDYCEDLLLFGGRFAPPTDNETCIEQGGKWFPARAVPPNSEFEDSGYCDMYHVCQQEYNDAQEQYSSMYFIIALVIGLITVGISVAMKLPSVSAGLMAGGSIVIIVGVMQYWQHSSDLLRFILLGIALAILIWIGYKKLG